MFFQTNFHHSVHYIFHAHVNKVIFPVAVPFVAINSNYPFICKTICGINVPCNFSPILKALFGLNGWKLIFRMPSMTSTNLQKIMLLRKDIAWIWRDWETTWRSIPFRWKVICQNVIISHEVGNFSEVFLNSLVYQQPFGKYSYRKFLRRLGVPVNDIALL